MYINDINNVTNVIICSFRHTIRWHDDRYSPRSPPIAAHQWGTFPRIRRLLLRIQLGTEPLPAFQCQSLRSIARDTPLLRCSACRCHGCMFRGGQLGDVPPPPLVDSTSPRTSDTPNTSLCIVLKLLNSTPYLCLFVDDSTISTF